MTLSTVVFGIAFRLKIRTWKKQIRPMRLTIGSRPFARFDWQVETKVREGFSQKAPRQIRFEFNQDLANAKRK